MNPLTSPELETALNGLPEWTIQDDQLVKTFELDSFRSAVVLIQRVAFEAEAMNHHPEIRNMFNRLQFLLCTHDAGDKVTEKDVRLAMRIESLARPFLRSVPV